MKNKNILIGAVTGVLSATFTLVFEKLLIDGEHAILAFVPTIGLVGAMIYLLIDQKKGNGGILSFGEGFKLSFVAASLNAVINSAVSYINMNFIKSKEQVHELVQIIASGMEKKGVPHQTAVDQVQKIFDSPWMSLANLGGGIALSAFLAVILAAIFKRNQELLDS